MGHILIPLFLTTVVTAVAADLTPMPFTRSDRAITAKAKTGDTFLDGREMLVDVTYAGWVGKGDLFIVFDKASGLFHWQYWVSSPKDPQARIADDLANESMYYVADDRLILFQGRDRNVYISESARHADSLEDAENKASKEAADRLGDALDKDHKQVKLPLPPEFFGPKDSPAPGRAKLIGVSKKDNTWELIVEGQWRRPGQWKARVVLDVGIPAKPNAESGMNPNGIPG